MAEHKPVNFTPTQPKALNAPQEAVAILDRELMDRAAAESRRSPRKRIILPFHKSHADVYQRMLNTIQPGSYIPPHRHIDPPKSESIVVLQGALCFIVFGEQGTIERHFDLRAGGAQLGVDIEPGVVHTFFALEPDTMVFEAKPGPYRAVTDKEFARWAPPEDDSRARAYLAGLYAATAHAAALPAESPS